jgi:YHS domain-containing protein
MKKLKLVTSTLLAIAFLAGPAAGLAADAKAKEKAKPYPLKTCLVSDEALGEMGQPYTFVHEGQEIKLCCKSCLKDFNKNPKKYLKKLEESQAKQGKANK